MFQKIQRKEIAQVAAETEDLNFAQRKNLEFFAWFNFRGERRWGEKFCAHIQIWQILRILIGFAVMNIRR